MDAIRRGAMMAMGKRAVGALGAASMIGGQLNQAVAAGYAAPTAYPSNMDLGKTQSAYINDGDYRAEKMGMEARYRAAKPLRDKINALRGDGFTLLEQAIGLHQRTTDLPALKSTAPWWRDHVAMDRARKRLSAIQQLENEWQKLVSAPLDQLEESFRNAVSAFLAEMQQP